jgi:site-specific recombinase XerD
MPVHFDTRKQRWRWTFFRRIDGRRYRASKLLPAGFTRKQADAYDQTQTARTYAIATGAEKPEPLIEHAIALYKENRTKHQRAGKKADQHLDALLEYYEGRPLSELAAISREFIRDQREALKPDTIRNRLAYLKAACRYAWKRHGLTEHDPTERMEIPAPSPGRQEYITVPELNRLLRQFDDREAAALCRMAFYTGLRWIRELLPRQPGEVKRAGRQLWLAAGMTKNGTPRMVPVHPAIQADLARLPFKRHWRDYYAAFERARKKAGMPRLRMHDLRHSLASAIISRGGTLADVQAALHHQDAASAKRYAHLYPERLRKVMGRI